MKLSKKWTTVTPLSKGIALALFVALPFIGFVVGQWYQAKLSQYDHPTYQCLPTR